MRENLVSRFVNRWLLVVSLLGISVTGTVHVAFASCIAALEPVELVTGRLAGEPVEERLHVNLGQVLGVAELETVKVWDETPDYTAASATVVTRYWGVPPPNDRHGLDDRLSARIDGGHFTGPSSTETTTSCGPSEALPLGSREYVAVFEVSDYVAIDSDLTVEQETILTQFLGEPVAVDAPVLPTEHPGTKAEPTTTSNSLLWWILGGLGAVAVGGAVSSLVRRSRQDAGITGT